MKTSTILRKARKMIENQEEEFICIAVKRVDADSSRAIRKEINARMGLDEHQCESLEWWVTKNGLAKTIKDTGYQNMKAYRLRWLDALIAEYEAKGD